MTNSIIKQTTSGIRLILYIASFLVLSVSFSLFFFPEDTATYFSWTINPPLTAAFLGAGYLSSFLLEFLSAKEKVWAKARPAIPAVWVFTFLTLIVTLLHIDRFHFDSALLITTVGTWVWLAVYISVPIAMGILWIHQVRQSGGDPPRVASLPRWLLLALLLQGAIMFLIGGVMLVFPDLIIPVWPWGLSPLTGRAIGAWGVGIGIIALQATWENDWMRLFPTMVSYSLYGILQLFNILRFYSSIDWTVSAIFYLVFITSIFLVGSFGMWRALSVKRLHENQHA